MSSLQVSQTAMLSKTRSHRSHSQAAIEYDVQKSVVPKVSSRSNDFVYVNTGYVGSLNSVSDPRLTEPLPATRVIREQYWACSRWPAGQRILAVAVGVLFGAVIGLGVTVALLGVRGQDVTDLFRARLAPD